MRSVDVVPAVGDMSSTETRIFWLEVIQLMQNVSTEFKLDAAANQANPRAAGWMVVFRRWAGSAAFGKVWESVKKDYNPVFREFVADLRAGQGGESWPDVM